MTPRASHPAAFVPLGCSLDDVRVEVDGAGPPDPTPDLLERWERARLANPRLFNGPILRYLSHTLAPARGRAAGSRSCVIAATADTYQRFAMQAHDAAAADPARDIYHLAVTGVVTARDNRGRESVVLGRRGGATSIYPHMWELAPGGGLDSTDIYSQLLLEAEEELGLPGLVDGSRREELLEPPAPRDVLGLAIDPNAPSADVVVRLRLREGAKSVLGADSWEYGSTSLVPVAELPAFIAREGERDIIPPTLAIWRGMGWI